MCKKYYLSHEELRILIELNMILNNLEKKLACDINLCTAVANVIDTTVETIKISEKLSLLQIKNPYLKNQILKLRDNCIKSCEEERVKVFQDISNAIKISNSNTQYINKIDTTIGKCILNYSIYLNTEYYKKYHKQDAENMGNDLLLILLNTEKEN